MFRIVSLIVLLALNTAMAQNKTKHTMHEAIKSYSKLLPFLSSDLTFTNPKYQKEIEDHLVSLVTAFKTSLNNPELKQSNFNANYQVITDHLDETLMTFRGPFKELARVKLTETSKLCFSCHTQISPDQMATFVMSAKKYSSDYFNDAYDYANFLFLLRNYKQSKSQYISYIKSKLSNKNKSVSSYYNRKVVDAFRKLLTIDIKVLSDLEQASKNLSKLEDQLELPKYLKQFVSSWKKQIKELQKEKFTQLKSDNDIESFIKKHMLPLNQKDLGIKSGAYDIKLLYTSGQLARYFKQNPNSKRSADILLWLGLTSNQLSNSLFFTLGDLYLKQCIDIKPHSEVAKKCYSHYASEVRQRYTGSAGEDIPDNVKNELKRLSSKAH